MSGRGLAIGLWVAALAGGMSSCAAGRPSPAQGEAMSEQLKQAVLKGDSSAYALARQLGRKANPTLLELAKNPEPMVRMDTMLCLAEAGGPEAVEALIAGLSDENPQVCGAALDGAGKHATSAQLPQLYKAYDTSPHGVYRGHIALLIGKLDKADPKELKKRKAEELDEDAREGLVVALARLGDKEEQQEFVTRLHASKGRVRGRWLDHGKYIHQPWLLKPLIPVLDDKEAVVRIGADDPESKIPEYLRACDVAVNLAASISARKFSFKVDGITNYAEPQVDEVRRFLKTVP
jgi:HEAT repeat protein